MRSFTLLKLAAQAEALRWRRTGRGYAIQAGLAAGAALFLLLLLVMLHAAAALALAKSQGAVTAVLIVAGVDLVIMAILGWLASRGAIDPVAVEAKRVRDEALGQVGDTAARGLMLAPLLRSQSAKKGLVGAAITAGLVGLLTRR